MSNRNIENTPHLSSGDASQDKEEADFKLTAGDLAVLKVSIADADAGRGRDGDSVLADLRERVDAIGFREISPYRKNPVEGAIFLEREL